jgi:hypothetical protein
MERRRLLLEILDDMVASGGDDLTPEQRESIEVAATAIRG